MRTIIRVRIQDVSAGKVRWNDLVTGEAGSASGPGWLEAGSEAVVEIEPTCRGLRINRVLEPQPPADLDAPSTITVNGSAPVAAFSLSEPPRGRTGPQPGDVRSAVVRFTSARTAERDYGSIAKARPCVVVEVDSRDFVAVRPIYGTNSAARRSGRCLRLKDWRAAGLRKSSVADLQVRWVGAADLGPLIGRVSEIDARRLEIDLSS